MGNTGNVGNYEVLTVRAVNFGTNQITFASPILKIYGATDSNATLTGQKIIVQRIPRYRNVTVSGILTANAWDGATGGLLFIKASGSLVVTLRAASPCKDGVIAPMQALVPVTRQERATQGLAPPAGIAETMAVAVRVVMARVAVFMAEEAAMEPRAPRAEVPCRWASPMATGC